MKKAGSWARLRKFIGWWLLAGGVVTFAVAIVFASSTAIFVHTAKVAHGKILNLVPVASQEENTVNYAPVFTFVAAAGQAYTITSDTSSNPPEFSVGETVQVFYNPQKPAGARLDSTVQLWL